MRRFLCLTFLLLAALLPLHAQTVQADQPSWPIDMLLGYSVSPNIVYSVASNYECKLDVYVRRGVTAPCPTVVYIHGGGWVGGTKEGATMQLLPYFEMGFCVVNVEYRLARVALAPGAVEDCRLALRWVFKNAKTYGFDTSRVVITGGSAGGHLALMTGMLVPSAGFDATKEWDQVTIPMPVAAIINWFGITDVKDLLGGANRQQYAVSWLGSQAGKENLATSLSPLTYVRPGGPAVLTVHGDNDDLVPYTHATRLHQALTAAKVPNKLLTIKGGKHGGFNREETMNCYTEIREFFRQNGILPATR